MNISRFSVVILLTFLASACTIHRIDIQQGNIIKPEQIEQLKTGLTKRQVRFIMGTPLIQDPFHADRWDYVFSLEPGNLRKVTEYQRITVFFKDDKLVNVDQKL
ncbi:MAG: outer membrane protein assembly factor BamE [Gammaproteobacteria bacterium]|nr:outer membrane protein assembly factor BamE [Gammaproteobacteria bacterium]